MFPGRPARGRPTPVAARSRRSRQVPSSPWSTMSHFICGFKSAPATNAALDAQFVRAIPRDRTKDPIRLDGQSANLTVYATRKAIPNTLIRADDGKSWLGVIGTPLPPGNPEVLR